VPEAVHRQKEGKAGHTAGSFRGVGVFATHDEPLCAIAAATIILLL